MSRIGKHPIVIPAGVTVEVKDGIITVKGKNAYTGVFGRNCNS
jgi:large subunit ribosomal protein L6